MIFNELCIYQTKEITDMDFISFLWYLRLL